VCRSCFRDLLREACGKLDDLRNSKYVGSRRSWMHFHALIESCDANWTAVAALVECFESAKTDDDRIALIRGSCWKLGAKHTILISTKMVCRLIEKCMLKQRESAKRIERFYLQLQRIYNGLED
jgi:hypothetical protein